MQRVEEYRGHNRRDAAGWMHIPHKLPIVICGFIVALYMNNVFYKQYRHATDERVTTTSNAMSAKNKSTPLEAVKKKRISDYTQYSDLEVSDAFSTNEKWRLRALAAEARLKLFQTKKDEADGSHSKVCGNANKTSYLLNATAISELNDLLLEKWRENDDPMGRWMSTVNIVNNVWDKHLRLLKLLKIANRDENKYFADFTQTPNKCNIITLGVGFDVDVENKFLKRHPECRFLAVDPQARRNRVLVEGLRGQFVHGAVAGTAGVYTAGVVGVGERRIEHMSFVDFMRSYNGNRVVDWLNIDVEKAELGILQTMHENSTLLPPICQFNVEVHYPPDREPQGYRSFVDLLEKIIRKGHYVPMHVELPRAHVINVLGLRYLRMFFFNVRDKECVSKFVC